MALPLGARLASDRTDRPCPAESKAQTMGEYLMSEHDGW